MCDCFTNKITIWSGQYQKLKFCSHTYKAVLANYHTNRDNEAVECKRSMSYAQFKEYE